MINHIMIFKVNKRRKSDRIYESILQSVLISTCLHVVIAFAPIDLTSRERLATSYRRTSTTKSPLISSSWDKSTSVGKATPVAIPIPSPTTRSQVKIPIWESAKNINRENKVEQSPNRLWADKLDVGTILSVGATIVPALGVAGVANGLELFSSSTWSGLQETSLDEFAASSSGAINPVVEGEIFSGLAHVALDLLTLAGPATIIVRLGAVVGRIFAMAADYIPDHNVVPEELVFQCLMLCIAWFGLVQSLIPVALSTFAYNINASNILSSSTDSRSKAQRLRYAKAYTLFFKSTGLSWNHFKAMSACAFEWITVAPGNVISTDENNATSQNGESEEDEHVYWLYNGTVKIQSQGKSLQDLQHSCRQGSSNSMDDAGCFMLFENRLLNKIVEKDSTSTINKKRGKEMTAGDVSKDKKSSNNKGMTLLASGSSDSLLLRINTSKLLMLMETDPQLSNSIRTLLLNSMQAKLNAQLSTGH
jgi:hypothetical protein